MKRIALWVMLAAASLTGLSCADTGGTVPGASSDQRSDVQKPTTTGVIMVKTVDGEPSMDQIVQHASTHAFVSWDGVSAPLGRIALMRRGSDLCSIRFTGFHREEEAPGVLAVGGPSYFAEYDWYHLTAQRIESGHRKVDRKPGWGFSFLMAFTRGSPFIKCGSFEPLWSYPNIVRFLEGNDRHDYGIELAPTNWRDVADVDVANPSLRWYRYDEKRRPILVPWEDLPQHKRQ